jgi:hypothetical protein
MRASDLACAGQGNLRGRRRNLTEPRLYLVLNGSLIRCLNPQIVRNTKTLSVLLRPRNRSWDTIWDKSNARRRRDTPKPSPWS